ncbi:hypothetical protein CDL15_Pgr011939 [Punica granatum]|uniref:Uncharacterized protein n=1 Tax=Punica granatum TaxID=22663 RepID=A0A218WD70_PUNGR|nr:hypothetical protein CDL15_Pgr011939 [Punica granatum]
MNSAHRSRLLQGTSSRLRKASTAPSEPLLNRPMKLPSSRWTRDELFSGGYVLPIFADPLKIATASWLWKLESRSQQWKGLKGWGCEPWVRALIRRDPWLASHGFVRLLMWRFVEEGRRCVFEDGRQFVRGF